MAEFLTSLANQYSVTGGHRFLMSATNCLRELHFLKCVMNWHWTKKLLKDEPNLSIISKYYIYS